MADRAVFVQVARQLGRLEAKPVKFAKRIVEQGSVVRLEMEFPARAQQPFIYLKKTPIRESAFRVSVRGPRVAEIYVNARCFAIREVIREMFGEPVDETRVAQIRGGGALKGDHHCVGGFFDVCK